LNYLKTPIHRVVPGGWIQGGGKSAHILALYESDNDCAKTLLVVTEMEDNQSMDQSLEVKGNPNKEVGY
jgi:hypothetical protein